MKLQLLLFFVFVTPLVLFFTIMLYGGITTEQVKKAISESGAYSQISTHFTKLDSATIANSNNYPIFVSKILTPTYFKIKTESVIDQTTNWITEKTQTPPEVSFKELKNELQSDYPDLLSEIEHIPTRSELQNSHLNVQEQAQYLEQAKRLNAFANTNFTISFGNRLDGIKFAYRILQIVLPILWVALIGSILLLTKFAHSPPSRYKWVGVTFVSSSIVGYGCILLHPFVTAFLLETHLFQESEFFSLFSPIIFALTNFYLEIYGGYQEIVSTVFLVVAAGCFLGAFLTRKQALPTIKPVYEGRSYWETPPKEIQSSQAVESQNISTENSPEKL